MSRPRAGAIFETVLYARDLEAIEKFYVDVMGLPLLERSELMAIFKCGPGVLLVFDPDLAGRPGRDVPSHGTEGEGHVAFAMPQSELDAWRKHFADLGVDVEMEVDWKPGGTSLYLRDPAGNSVELAPSTLWGGDWDF